MIQQNARPGSFDDLATAYGRYRIGYSSELYNLLEKLGLQRGMHVLDVGCGTGISMEPLISRGMRLTGLDPSADMLALAKSNVAGATLTAGSVEELPFAAGTFDAATCAQAFHWFDADKAFAELMRVVKPGGPIAVWWKILGADDPIRALRTAACARAGVAAGRDSLAGGFAGFYRAPFATRTLRVLPFTARFRVEDWIGYERSRASARNAYGPRCDAYVAAMSDELTEKYGSLGARMDVRYTQYLYFGTTACA